MPSYTLTLSCGCTVYVSCHPMTGVAHTRVVETHAQHCRRRRHERGTRLSLWELLPDPQAPAIVRFAEADNGSAGRVTPLC
ncbi:MAG: hypothetical protein AB7I25_05115 [Vicinamibacterales bacterium]